MFKVFDMGSTQPNYVVEVELVHSYIICVILVNVVHLPNNTLSHKSVPSVLLEFVRKSLTFDGIEQNCVATIRPISKKVVHPWDSSILIL